MTQAHDDLVATVDALRAELEHIATAIEDGGNTPLQAEMDRRFATVIREPNEHQPNHERQLDLLTERVAALESSGPRRRTAPCMAETAARVVLASHAWRCSGDGPRL